MLATIYSLQSNYQITPTSNRKGVCSCTYAIYLAYVLKQITLCSLITAPLQERLAARLYRTILCRYRMGVSSRASSYYKYTLQCRRDARQARPLSGL